MGILLGRSAPAAIAVALAAAILAASPAGAAPSPSPSPSPSPGSVDDQLARARDQQKLIDDVRTKLGSSLADGLSAQTQLERSLRENSEQQTATQKRIDDADAQIAKTDADLGRLDRQILLTQQQVELEQRQLAALARALYSEPESILVLVAESRSLSDLVTRTQDIDSAGRRAASLRQRIKSDLAALQRDRSTAEGLRAQQAAAREARGRDLAALQDLRQKQERSKRDLEGKMAETKKELESVAGQSVDLAQRIAKLLEEQQQQIIATAMQQVWDQLQVWEKQNPVGSIRTSNGHSKKYRFVWPLPAAQISQGFGPSDLGLEPAMNGFAHFHAGIDLVMPSGTPIQAADDGVVALVGSGTTGYGNYVVIAHAGGISTLYGHLNLALVKPGDTVAQGQPIGLEGSTGNSTGPHLHFEARISGRPVDPAPFLPPGLPSPFRD